MWLAADLPRCSGLSGTECGNNPHQGCGEDHRLCLWIHLAPVISHGSESRREIRARGQEGRAKGSLHSMPTSKACVFSQRSV